MDELEERNGGKETKNTLLSEDREFNQEFKVTTTHSPYIEPPCQEDNHP